MKFSDFIHVESVIMNLESATKEGVIREMVESLANTGGVPEGSVEKITQALLRREELGPTSIGNGMAVPHAKLVNLDGCVGSIAFSADGVDFDSYDHEKVKLFFLLISPPDRPGEHLRALEHITRYVKDSSFLEELKSAKEIKDVKALLERVDSEKAD